MSTVSYLLVWPCLNCGIPHDEVKCISLMDVRFTIEITWRVCQRHSLPLATTSSMTFKTWRMTSGTFEIHTIYIGGLFFRQLPSGTLSPVSTITYFAISSAMHCEPFPSLYYQKQFKSLLFLLIYIYIFFCRISFKMRSLLVMLAIGLLVALAYAGKWIDISGGTVFT